MHAYFDDSRSGNEFIVLAGFVASAERWNSFNSDWVTVLRRHKMSHLHTSDYLSMKARLYDEQGTYSERLAKLDDFASAIRKNLECAVAIGVDVQAYKSALAGMKGANADVFCMERVLLSVHRFVHGSGLLHEIVEFGFDDSESSSSKILGAWHRVRKRQRIPPQYMSILSFCDDEFVPAIQAADMLACATIRKVKNKSWGEDDSFQRMFKHPNDKTSEVPMIQESWTKERILKHRDLLRELAGNNKPAY